MKTKHNTKKGNSGGSRGYDAFGRSDRTKRTRAVLLEGFNDNRHVLDHLELDGIVNSELPADADGHFHPYWHRS